MEQIRPDEWLRDMSLNERGHVEVSFFHEGKQYVIEITENDARGINHSFKLARIGGEIK